MRTTTIDPLAEKYYSISPYAWCGNNPVNVIDPDGMELDWVEDKNHHVYWDDNAKSQETTKHGDKYIGKTTFATDSEGNVFYGNETRHWNTFAPVPEVTVTGDKDYKYHHSIANAVVGELANGRLDDGGYGPWNPDAINFEAGASGSFGALSGTASLGLIFSNSELALSLNTSRNGGLSNSSGLRSPSVGLFGEMNLLKNRTNNSMSLEPYRGAGINSNVTVGNIGLNYGTGPNRDLYKSYGINVNTTPGVGFSQGLTNSFYLLYYKPGNLSMKSS